MEEQTQNSENFEIPSRWKRFSAYILDLIINITLIWLFINLIIIFSKKTTLWNIVVWIKTTDNNSNQLPLWKALTRFWFFYSTFFLSLYFIFLILFYYFSLPLGMTRNCIPENDIFCKINLMMYLIKNFVIITILTINIIELFFKCPTFIDKRLWIKRIYKKSKKNNEQR